MKRLLAAALSFAVFALPAFADEARPPSGQIADRTPANTPSGSALATGVWKNDQNFVAPAP